MSISIKDDKQKIKDSKNKARQTKKKIIDGTSVTLDEIASLILDNNEMLKHLLGITD